MNTLAPFSIPEMSDEDTSVSEDNSLDNVNVPETVDDELQMLREFYERHKEASSTNYDNIGQSSSSASSSSSSISSSALQNASAIKPHKKGGNVTYNITFGK